MSPSTKPLHREKRSRAGVQGRNRSERQLKMTFINGIYKWQDKRKNIQDIKSKE